MKRLFVVLVLLVVGSSAFVIAKVARSNAEERIIIIRVTSPNPKEEMAFDASYIFNAADSQLQNVERQTPFEVKVKSDFVAGIFRKKSGSGDLQVALTTSADGKPEQGHVKGSGDIVVVTTRAEEKYRFSVQALSVK
jgi:hypothetical protein